MGFHLRKSFKLGALRFNLSNSGIGFSTGIKGLRVGVDGKGRSYVGGGKGMFRFRKQINGQETVNSSSYISKEALPEELQKLFINVYDILLMAACFIPFLFAFLFSLAALFAPKFSFSTLILGLSFTFLFLLPYKKIISAKRKKLKSALVFYENNNLENALIAFHEFQKYKFKTWSADNYIQNQILNCYWYLKDYQKAYEFLKNNFSVSNRRERIVQCLYNLEKWDEIISYMQKEYINEEKEEHPVYYAMLSKAFLKQGKTDIALETCLSGPINKRTMNDEMCAFRYSLAECYEASGDKTNALKQYEKIYSYDINFEDVKDKIEKLRN